MEGGGKGKKHRKVMVWREDGRTNGGKEEGVEGGGGKSRNNDCTKDTAKQKHMKSAETTAQTSVKRSKKFIRWAR